MTLFDGLDGIIDEELGLNNGAGQPPHFYHQQALHGLANVGLPLNGIRLINRLRRQMESNWCNHINQDADMAHIAFSQQNFRFTKQLEIARHNLSPEVTLERAISRVSNENWANQIPVDSGFLNTPHAKYIDLAFREGCTFEVIELKVEANTPLSAAMQVLKYGLALLFVQYHLPFFEVNNVDQKLLVAKRIRLRVLAPQAYYAIYQKSWPCLLTLEEQISVGLEYHFNNPAAAIAENFRFHAFPNAFEWDPQHVHNTDDPAALNPLFIALQQRETPFANEQHAQE